MSEIEFYSIGLCCMSVCFSLPVDDVIERANSEHPTGISSRWYLSDDKTFKTGQTNPCSCERNPETHKHYLLNC